MIRILIKPLLGVILIFAIVATLGLTLWLINDLWLVILAIVGVMFLAKYLGKK